MRHKTLLIFAIFVLLALSACSSLGIGKAADPTSVPTAAAQGSSSSGSNGVIAEGHVEPVEHKTLSFASPGRVAELLVQKGDTVSAGQVVARLENSEEAQAALQAAQVEVEAAQQALDDLNRTSGLVNSQANVALIKANLALVVAEKNWSEIDTQQTKDDIETASTEVADAEKELNNARDDFDPYKDLPEDNAQRKSAQQTLDDAEKKYSDAVLKRDDLINARELAYAELGLAKNNQIEAQHTFDQTASGADAQALKLAELRLQAAQAQAAAAQAALDNLELKAPFAGEIFDVNVVPGELSGPSGWAVLLADTAGWVVRTSDLTELEVVQIEEGQSVTVVPDALPELKLDGVVEEISRTFTTKTGDILYETVIRLKDTDPLLRWGMTVEAAFQEK